MGMGISEYDTRRADRRRAYRWLALGFVVTAASGLDSSGIYHEDDLKHFLLARWVQYDFGYLLDSWGRPGFTALYALPSMIGSPQVGWHAARLLSAVLAALTALLAWKIAGHYRLRRAWLAIPLLYMQPLFTHLSLTTLTETPLAFLFALGTWLLLKRRLYLAVAVLALTPLTRQEAIVLLPLWMIFLWRQRAGWSAYPLLFWAMAAHNLLAGWLIDYWPIMQFFRPTGAEHYGQGTPLTFVPKWLFAAGPVVAVLAVMGVRILRRRRDGWLCLAATAIYFAAETAVYMRSAYASGGYSRFLVPMAPWVAVMAAVGAAPWFWRRLSVRRRMLQMTGGGLLLAGAICQVEFLWNRPPINPDYAYLIPAARWAIVAAMAVVMVLLASLRRCPPAGHPCLSGCLLKSIIILILVAGPWLAAVPMHLGLRHHVLRITALHIERNFGADRTLIAPNGWIYFWTDRWMPMTMQSWSRQLDQASPGTLFVWDRRFCLDPDLNLPADQFEKNPQWRKIWTGPALVEGGPPFAMIFERL